MNILQNKNLIIESKTFGSELTRIYSKNTKQDILWCGDDKYWARRSPILFPIVGKLKDNKITIENHTYTMGQHGFARDMEFQVIETTENSISYQLNSDDNTKSFYPYNFELIIKYTLIENSVKIDWTIKNTDDKEIYFSIGAHPAFNVPLNQNESLDDYYLKFKTKDQVKNISLNGSYSDKITDVESLDTIDLKADLFKNDALIYTNVDEISICNNKCEEKIKVDMKDFPLVGIWSPYYKESESVAPFVCIEPWYGLADNIDSDYDYKNKSYINILKVGECFNASYTITVM